MRYRTKSIPSAENPHGGYLRNNDAAWLVRWDATAHCFPTQAMRKIALAAEYRRVAGMTLKKNAAQARLAFLWEGAARNCPECLEAYGDAIADGFLGYTDGHVAARWYVSAITASLAVEEIDPEPNARASAAYREKLQWKLDQQLDGPAQPRQLEIAGT